ncbi:transposase [Bradyrhizobium brasilense]|uniref:transposase n=1 Tax=Bradyrhizobium brasilense TaxID=1419277 RepID=UPI001E28DBE8|nr:transposase [Bradyrhizobium brasilense]MCC8969796.1 transposase [Bradyrhizobium brasilense]
MPRNDSRLERIAHSSRRRRSRTMDLHAGFDVSLDPRRFRKSTNVRAHLRLAPRRHKSGQTGRIGSTTKCGDELTRAMPHKAAITILTSIPNNFMLRLGSPWLAGKKGLKCAPTPAAMR